MNKLIIQEYTNKFFQESVTLLKEHFNINNSIKSIENNDRSFSIITIANKKVIGFIKVDKLKDIGKDCYYYILNYVCVDKDYQNMNIGTKMLEYIFNKAKKDNIKYIELTSKPIRSAANHLYLKNNFFIKDTNVFIKEI